MTGEPIHYDAEDDVLYCVVAVPSGTQVWACQGINWSGFTLPQPGDFPDDDPQGSEWPIDEDDWERVA